MKRTAIPRNKQTVLESNEERVLRCRDLIADGKIAELTDSDVRGLHDNMIDALGKALAQQALEGSVIFNSALSIGLGEEKAHDVAALINSIEKIREEGTRRRFENCDCNDPTCEVHGKIAATSSALVN
jgi:hypothetical protein